MTTLKFRLDNVNFPMVWVEKIKAYIHWIPVTKIQFEYFLCAVTDSHFNSNWYDEVLSLNPRITPSSVRANNYWNALLSGIKPSEVQRYTRWCGPGYTIPTLGDWFAAYTFLKSLPTEPISVIEQLEGMRERTCQLLTHLDAATQTALTEAGYERTLADQMMMRLGLLEWVEYQRTGWGGMGEVNPRFHGMLFRPDDGKPSTPTNPEADRLKHYGFRLIWREG